MVLESLSSESVERADQRAKSSGTENVTMNEDAVENVANWGGDAVEDVGECESHRRSRGKWSRCHCDDWQRGSEIVREPDYLKFLAEAEKSQSSNEQLWTDSDLENDMRRCKKDWADEEQEELMESLKTLYELKESWKNMIHNEEVDKSGDENPRLPCVLSRVFLE